MNNIPQFPLICRTFDNTLQYVCDLLKTTQTCVCLKHTCDTCSERLFSSTQSCFHMSTPTSNGPGCLWVVNVIIPLFMSPYSHWLAAPLAPTPYFDRNNSCLAREKILVSTQTNLVLNYLQSK